MNDKRSQFTIMNDIMNDTVNDKKGHNTVNDKLLVSPIFKCLKVSNLSDNARRWRKL